MPKFTLDHRTGNPVPPRQYPSEDEEDDDDDEEDDLIDDHDLSDDDEDSDEDDHDFSENGSWVDVPRSADRDDIEPSESASRSRRPAQSQRTLYAPRVPPTRRPASSRKYPPEVPPSPPGPPPRRGARDRPRRPKSTAGEATEEDDYTFGHHGRGHYGAHPGQGWSGFNMYGQSGQVRTVVSDRDPFGAQYDYANQNPFTMPPDDYYGGRRPNRNSMGPRVSGHELMPTGPYGAFPGYPPGYPPPPFPPYGYPPGYPPHHSPSPHPPASGSKKGTPAPDGASKEGAPDAGFKAIEALLIDQRKREEMKEAAAVRAALEAKAAAAEAKRKAEEDKLMSLQNLIIEHNKQQLEREKKAEEQRKAEVAATKAAQAQAAEEKRRAEEKEKEIKAAAERAKLEAEVAAAKKAAEEKEKAEKEAAETKEKHDKALAEAQKKAAEMEAAKKKAEEEAKSLRPGDDMVKPPIRFKDAVGRKFSFPWHLCKTWKGMQALIHQAFLHVDVIGQHVHDGHYDLIGPDGEIILPQVWETMVKPDWSITMHMWPIAEPKKPDLAGIPPITVVHGKGKKGSKKKGVIPIPPAPPMAPPGATVGGAPGIIPLGAVPPPPPPGAAGYGLGIPLDKPDKKDKKKGGVKTSKGLLLWAAGGPPNRGSSMKVRRKG